MRYLVFGDVHGNLEALETVLDQTKRHRIDGYLCLGDLVGYGPNPLQCLHRVHRLDEEGLLAWVLGNHDLALRGDSSMDHFSNEAARTLEWTRSLVHSEPWARDFLAAAHTTTEVNGKVWLTHDSLAIPTSGGYSRTVQNARLELQTLRQKGGWICFYGHTHSLRAELLADPVTIMLAPMNAHEDEGFDAQPLSVPAGQLAWVGSGSVGFPTNKKRLAEYLVLDDEKRQVEKYAVAYPRQVAKDKARRILSAPCGAAVAERIARWL